MWGVVHLIDLDDSVSLDHVQAMEIIGLGWLHVAEPRAVEVHAYIVRPRRTQLMGTGVDEEA